MGASEDKILGAFRERFAYDLGLKRLRPAQHYQRVFGGFEDLIAREYERLAADAASTPPDDRTAGRLPPADPRPPAEPLPPAEPARAAPPPEARVGPYRLLRELGRGGQAVVHLAEDTRLSRNVALKLFTPGLLASDHFLARFRREAETASRLDHPGICTIFEAGVEGETPYIAMRHVEGRTLSESIEATKAKAREPGGTSSVDLPTTSVAETSPALTRIILLVEKVARALHAAHEEGLIHRDVKPGNIMVTRDGEPVVLDFGLAREDEGGHTLTATGALVGTPAYMSPEQIVADRSRIDRRTDVYSLGVTLYECLTLRLPFSAPTREGLFHQILKSEPEAPRRSNPRIPKDLEVLLLTAMDKDPDRRYQTALDLAEDLRRLREHEPIRARPAPQLVRLARWAQRHPATATGVASVFVLLAIALGITSYYLGEVSDAQQETKRALDTSREETAAKSAALTRARVVGLAAASSEALATDPIRALLLAREAVRTQPSAAAISPLHRALVASLERAELRGHEERLRFACFSPSGDRIVTTSWDRTARLWDLSGKELAVLRGHEASVVSAVFSAAGDRILTAGEDRTARLWDLAGNELAALRGHGGGVWSATFSKTGDRIVTASSDGTARVWDLSGNEIALLRGHEGGVNAAMFAAGGERVVTASGDGTARVWDLAGHVLAECRGHQNLINDAAVSPAGDRFVTASFDGTARVWDLAGKELAVLQGHRSEVTYVAFSPSGDRIATVGNDWTARVWDLSGNPLAVLANHEENVRSASFSASGDRIVTGSYDKTARVWDLAGKELAVLRGHDGWVTCAAFSPSGDRVVTASVDKTARVWELPGREVARTNWGDFVHASLSPSGDRVVTAHPDATARVRDMAGKELVVLRGHQQRVHSACWSPSGDRIVTSSWDTTARVWDAAGDLLLELPGHDGRCLCANFSPAGDRIVTGDYGVARVFDMSGRQIAEMRGHKSWVVGASFSPSGDRVLTASYDGTAALWDLSGNQLVALRTDAPRPVHLNSASFSPSGGRIVTGSDDRTARVWDADGREIATLHGHTGIVWSASFSAAGDRIVTASADGTARVWDPSGNELAVLRGHESAVWFAAFTPSGDRIVTASRDGTVLVWLVRTEDLLRLADSRIPREFTDEERTVYGELLRDAR